MVLQILFVVPGKADFEKSMKIQTRYAAPSLHLSDVYHHAGKLIADFSGIGYKSKYVYLFK